MFLGIETGDRNNRHDKNSQYDPAMLLHSVSRSYLGVYPQSFPHQASQRDREF
jgi:hypothetical protein